MRRIEADGSLMRSRQTGRLSRQTRRISRQTCALACRRAPRAQTHPRQAASIATAARVPYLQDAMRRRTPPSSGPGLRLRVRFQVSFHGPGQAHPPKFGSRVETLDGRPFDVFRAEKPHPRTCRRSLVKCHTPGFLEQPWKAIKCCRKLKISQLLQR